MANAAQANVVRDIADIHGETRRRVDILERDLMRHVLGYPVYIAGQATYSAKIGDMVVLAPGEATVRVDLPQATTKTIGRVISIINFDDDFRTITIQASGGDTVNGEESIEMYDPWRGRMCVQVTATDWVALEI